jgi:hypothetical protein
MLRPASKGNIVGMIRQMTNSFLNIIDVNSTIQVRRVLWSGSVLDLSPQCSVSIGEFVIILACVDIYQDGQRTSYIRIFFLSKTL